MRCYIMIDIAVARDINLKKSITLKYNHGDKFSYN